MLTGIHRPDLLRWRLDWPAHRNSLASVGLFCYSPMMHNRPTVDRNCAVCGFPYKARIDQLNAGRGKICSPTCAAKLGAAARHAIGQDGENNPAWKHGRARSTERRAAWNAVYKAVRSGRLSRKPCIRCGNAENIHAHHDNYNRPLDIIWLCRKCHDQHHRI